MSVDVVQTHLVRGNDNFAGHYAIIHDRKPSVLPSEVRIKICSIWTSLNTRVFFTRTSVAWNNTKIKLHYATGRNCDTGKRRSKAELSLL